MTLSEIDAAAEECRKLLGLPPIDTMVAVRLDKSFEQIESLDHLKASLEKRYRIGSGLSCYNTMNPHEAMLAGVLVNLDRVRRYAHDGNYEKASMAIIDIGVTFGRWKFGSSIDRKRQSFLEVQSEGSRAGATAMKRNGIASRRIIVDAVRSIWKNNPHLIGKYSDTARAVIRHWSSYPTDRKCLSFSRTRTIISEECNHGALSDFFA